MRALLKLLRSVTGRKSVADALATFNQVVDDLDIIAGREAQKAFDLQEQAADLNAQATVALDESAKAVTVAVKVRQLLSA